MRHILLTILICLTIAKPALAIDSSWEHHKTALALAKKIKPPSQVIWLGEEKKYLALYIESRRRPKLGAVIIVPDFGSHANWQQLIRPIRTSLPHDGWSTLSVDVGGYSERSYLIENNSIYQSLKKKLDLAVAYLKQKGLLNIALVAHGHSATLTTKWLAESGELFAGMAAINMVHYERKNPSLDVLPSLSQITAPFLDVSGEKADPATRNTLHIRAEAASIAANSDKYQPVNTKSTLKTRQLAHRKTGNLNFRQKVFPEADHFFSHHQNKIVKYVRGWLRRYARGSEIQLK